MSKDENPGPRSERDLVDLILGKKKPESEADKKLMQEVEAIKKKGGQVYIPHD